MRRMQKPATLKKDVTLRYDDRRPSYTLQIFPGHQPGFRPGTPGAVGPPQGHRPDRNRGLYPSRLAGGARRKACPRRGRAVRPQRRVPAAATAVLPVSGGSPVRGHRGNQLDLQERTARPARCTTSSCCPVWTRRRSSPTSWRPSATSTPTGGPFWGWTAATCWRSPWKPVPDAVFIPAHIWTPHFSLFGAFSGFDAIEECFEDLTPHIQALETGLSSDPPMNWRVSALDRFTLVSNSDAHSPGKLGREANLLDIAAVLSRPVRAPSRPGKAFVGTIEFFPEEGKYHYDGHRNCGLCLKPAEDHGVRRKMPGVRQKAHHRGGAPGGGTGRPSGGLRPARRSSLSKPGSPARGNRRLHRPVRRGKKVAARYESMLKELGPEFFILREAPLEDVGQVAGPCVQEGLRRLRAGQVLRSPGYDGEYGTIQLLDKTEIEALGGQQSLFGVWAPAAKQKKPLPEARRKIGRNCPGTEPRAAGNSRRAVFRFKRPAEGGRSRPGPGGRCGGGPRHGKNQDADRPDFLSDRGNGGLPPSDHRRHLHQQGRRRIKTALGGRSWKKGTSRACTVGTFHSICLELLQKANPGGVGLIGPYEARELAEQVIADAGLEAFSQTRCFSEISKISNTGRTRIRWFQAWRPLTGTTSF